MAIKDMKGTVSTTGVVNAAPPKIEAPDMSKIKMPTNKKVNTPKEVVQKPVPQNTPREEGLLQKVQNLTDQDKTALASVLSPSVINALKKIAPDLSPLLDQAGSTEENVIIPVSVAKNFAAKRYGGQNETEAITNFIADLQNSVSSIDNTMDQTNVPPENMQASQNMEEIAPDVAAIDQPDLATA